MIRLLLLLVGLLAGIADAKQDKTSTSQPQLECIVEGLHPLLIVTYKNITITQETKYSVPHNDRLFIRCREVGRYKLIGESMLRCRNGVWSADFPSCMPTTEISNYTEDVPPTILFGLPSGAATFEPSGALAVFPGSILHLECLFSRRLGNPEWTWTSKNPQYLTGWAIAKMERELKYRLSIYYAKAQDSGTYTCSTPRGLTNSIKIHVVDVHCPTLMPEEPLIAKIEGPRLGEIAQFECPPGWRLKGASIIRCQYNGKWTSGVPSCVKTICPSLQPTNPKLQMLEYNNTFDGRAEFTCMWGHKLKGSAVLRCGDDSNWSAPMPTCTEITCPTPIAPKNGRIELPFGVRRDIRVISYRTGALVRFSCLPGHQVIGQSSAICTENGTWSHPPPTCDVRCPYPGDPTHGRIAPLKFWYKSGDTIQVTCSPGYVTPLEPVKKPTCRENGIWSGPPPPCRSYKDV